jgi:hypothetical protein
MMPRLQGEESIRAANQMAVGAGNLEPEASRQIVSLWTDHDDGPAALPSASRRMVKPDELRASLAAAGFGYRRVQKATPTS